jgi:hypothetical protein
LRTIFGDVEQAGRRGMLIPGIYLKARLEREKQCVLVLATPGGRSAVKARKIGAVCCSI